MQFLPNHIVMARSNVQGMVIRKLIETIRSEVKNLPLKEGGVCMPYVEKKAYSRPNEFFYGKANLDDSRTGADERFNLNFIHGKMIRFEDDTLEEIVFFEKMTNMSQAEKDLYLTSQDFYIDEQHMVLVTKTETGEKKVRMFKDVRYNTGKHKEIGRNF